MNSFFHPISRVSLWLLASALIASPISIAKEKSQKEQAVPEKPTSRLLLKNGDRLSGSPISLNDKQHLLFESVSLRRTAHIPLANVLSLELNGWKQHPPSKTTARVTLHSRFNESTGDTILGDLHELSPESIKLKTWYGGIISIKRAMVKSLNIISNSPGNYYGPNNIKEWSLPSGDDTWKFNHGKLISQTQSSIGRDVGLREKSHISFDAAWSSSMRFKCIVYSSDVTSRSPSACYEININQSYAYLRTQGKIKGGAMLFRGGRWKQLHIRPENNHAHFDFFVNRKAGTVDIFINHQRACMLLSQSPDPSNLGTGLSFSSVGRNSLEISSITVTPWNGTTLPKTVQTIKPNTKDPKKNNPEKKHTPPHRIILNNGDVIPGTVGKVQNGRMLVNTEFTAIHIPIEKIKSLSLGDSGEHPRKYKGDIRAWFHSGGFVTLRLSSLSGQKITGYSQALGDVSFDLSAFSRIDFHIDNRKANHTRELLH